MNRCEVYRKDIVVKRKQAEKEITNEINSLSNALELKLLHNRIIKRLKDKEPKYFAYNKDKSIRVFNKDYQLIVYKYDKGAAGLTETWCKAYSLFGSFDREVELIYLKIAHIFGYKAYNNGKLPLQTMKLILEYLNDF